LNRLHKKIPPYQRAIAKAHLCSTGIPPQELVKPLIAIANSWNEIVPGHCHLQDVARKVKKGILAAGGYPLEFNTIALCDGIAQGHQGMKYSLPSRDLIADSVELMVRGHGIFDGIVLIASCDKIVPAMLMAAARLEIPAIVVTGGPMLNTITPREAKIARREFIAGNIKEEQLIGQMLKYYPGPGVCPFLGTANTMGIVAETLGMALPGMALTPANSAAAMHLAYASGQQVVQLVNHNLLPRQILTLNSLYNAITMVCAIGGSMNSILHLLALAQELGLPLTLGDIQRISDHTPLLTKVVPNDLERTVSDLYRAGGVSAILNELLPLLSGHELTVTGQTLKENVQGCAVTNRNIIRPLGAPIAATGGIVILYGSLAPQGAVVKVSAVGQESMVFRGTARIFASEEAAIEAVQQNRIPPGSVIVVRFEGPRGGPGMRELHRLTEIAGQITHVAVVTDGRFSGATSGLAIGHVSPEAAVGGPLARLQEGDLIEINIPERQLEVLVPLSEFLARPIPEHAPNLPALGYLHWYAQLVGPADKGAGKTL